LIGFSQAAHVGTPEQAIAAAIAGIARGIDVVVAAFAGMRRMPGTMPGLID
jgi:hypothetical protein